MKSKFAVNAEIDFITKDEMKEVIGAWWSEIGRGVRFRYIDGQATAAAGVWDMTIPGPRVDFIWAVTRLTASGAGLTLGTDTWQVAVNEAAPSRLVGSGFTRNATFDLGVFVLNGGDALRINGTSTPGTGAVAIAGGVVELPAQLAWQLL